MNSPRWRKVLYTDERFITSFHYFNKFPHRNINFKVYKKDNIKIVPSTYTCEYSQFNDIILGKIKESYVKEGIVLPDNFKVYAERIIPRFFHNQYVEINKDHIVWEAEIFI